MLARYGGMVARERARRHERTPRRKGMSGRLVATCMPVTVFLGFGV